ncbi:MAG: isochorismate synthase [Actinomycetota bacterium]
MLVIPNRANLFQDRQLLYQFLWDCQQSLMETEQTKIVSISLEMPEVDPLAALQRIAEPEHLHFYFEKRDKEKAKTHRSDFAVAAIDATLHLTVAGSQRFSRALDFIQSSLARTITLGSSHLPFSGPHFFCSFTFFEESGSSNSYFPSATIFLPKWQISKHNHHCILVANITLDSQTNLQKLTHSIWEQFQAIQSSQFHPLTTINNSQKYFHKINWNNPNQFKESVNSSLDLIHQGYLRKIVLSHAIDVIASTPLNLTNSLNNLRLLYPDCYIFSVSNGCGQNFMGASPERLISIDNNELLIDALAGSVPRGNTPPEDVAFANQLLASDKDLREHRVVVDFITQRLSHLGLKPHLLPLPHLLQLSNIQHLWTPIKAQVSSQIHLLEILAKLHPTPAVAGSPREIAKEQIRRCESFDRSVYAAPLGWVDYRGNGEFAVGIRSAVIDGNRARLYAGAGIVAGSEPDKELAEIKWKFQAILNALV